MRNSSVGAHHGEVMNVRRWDPLNHRQFELLKRINDGEDLSTAEHSRLRHPGNALRDRGLISISRRNGLWHALITEAGQYYLDHDHHPDDPRFIDHTNQKPAAPTPARLARPTSAVPTASASSPRRPPLATVRTTTQRRAEATGLIEHLVTNDVMVIAAPTGADTTKWRKIVDFAKRHQLVPEDHHVEKTRQWNGDLHIRLIPGPHGNTRQEVTDLPPVPTPTSLRSPHPVIANLRDDPGRLVMPKSVRHRSLLILQAVAAEATRRGHQVKTEPVPERHHFHYYGYGARPSQRYSRREGTFAIVASGFNYSITIQQTSPQSADTDKAERLLLELPHDRDRPQQRWSDGKIRRLEDALPAILHDIQQRVELDQQRRAEKERAAHDRRARWQHAMATARTRATEAYFATILDHQLANWQRAKHLRSYRDELAQRLADERPNADTDSARHWLDWINQHITRTDPALTPPPMPDPPDLSPDDLKPYLGRWSPHGPDDHLPSWERQW